MKAKKDSLIYRKSYRLRWCHPIYMPAGELVPLLMIGFSHSYYSRTVLWTILYLLLNNICSETFIGKRLENKICKTAHILYHTPFFTTIA